MNTTQLIQATAPTLHAKYSPNLHKWLKKQRPAMGLPGVYRNIDTKQLEVVWRYPDDLFVGSRMNQILCAGSRARVYSYARATTSLLELIPDFWLQYIAVGRCAVDPEHRQHFIGDETRWETIGDVRGCTWCNKATQRLRRWTETVERKAWENVDPAPGSAMLPPADKCGDKTCAFVNIESGGSRCTTCGFECPF